MSEQQPEVPAIPGGTRWGKKPVTVSAIQWTGANFAAVRDFAAGALGAGEVARGALPLWVVKSQALCHVQRGDWIIREVDGSGFYPCAADVFAATYEPASESLILPGDETPWTPEQLAEFQAHFDAAMANPGPLRVLPSDWNRAVAAEAKLAEVRELAGQLVTATHPTIGGTFAASIGHKFLAIIGTDEEAAFARQLIAQAEAADAGYKVAAVRAALYTFLHQYGRSTLPAFKVAIDLAVSLRKIIDDLGSDEEPSDG